MFEHTTVSSTKTQGLNNVDTATNKTWIDEEDVDNNIFHYYDQSNNHNTSAVNNNKNNNTHNKNGISPLPFHLNPSSFAFTFQSIDDIQPFLSSLQNEHSTFMEVAKACHFLNQFGTHGSYNATPNSSSTSSSSSIKVVQSSILRIEQYTSDISHILNVLSNTATHHYDRRCRIIAIQSLAKIANTTLMKLIITPQLYYNRTNSIHVNRIQDEICNDVIMTITNCILDDDDDGVSVTAMECLSYFIHNDLCNRNNMTKEIYALSCRMMTKNNHLVPKRTMWDGEGGDYGCGGYADSVQDVDYMTQRADLQWRIFEYVLGPRVRKIFVRVCLYKDKEHRIKCLSVLNDIVMFVHRTDRARKGEQLGKDGYAKRWYEFDSSILLQEYVDIYLLPLLRSCYEEELEASLGVVVNALTLCSAVTCKEMWFDQILALSVANLEHQLVLTQFKSTTLEMKSNVIATLLIALRGIQHIEKRRLLVLVAENIVTMPSTHSIPKDVISPALQFEDGSRRMPSRVGFWTEIALAMFLPDSFTSAQNPTFPSKMGSQVSLLKHFLESASIKSLIDSRTASKTNATIDPAEEMVYVFCSVAYSIGKQIIPVTNSIIEEDECSDLGIEVNSQSTMSRKLNLGSWIQSEYNSWLLTSLELLNAFLPCFKWNSESTVLSNVRSINPTGLDEAVTFRFASQRAYLELLKVVLISTDSLNTSSSVFLHFCCSMKRVSNDTKLNTHPHTKISNIGIDLKAILENILKELSQSEDGLCRRLRIATLAILSDAWSQETNLLVYSNNISNLNRNEMNVIDGDVATINEQQARELLSLLGSEIAKILAEDKQRCSDSDKVTASEAQRYLKTCISCVETIGYSAQKLVKHLSKSNTDIVTKESGEHIVSVCIVVLKGQGKVEIESDEDDVDTSISSDSAPRSHMLDTPPRSPSSRAQTTLLTTQCSNGAQRLQKFMAHHDDKLDSQERHQYSSKMSYVCPLFKLADFGADQDDRINDYFLLYDQFSLLNICNQFDSKFEESLLKTSEEALMFLHQLFAGDVYNLGYLLRLSCQTISQFVELALEASTLHFIKNGKEGTNLTHSFPPKNKYSLRLGTVPLSMERFPSGCKLDEKKALFPNSVSSVSAGSDPLQVNVSYAVRQLSRFDGDVEWGLVVTVTVHNITAVTIPNGIILDASIHPKRTESAINVTRDIMSETSIFKNSLESGGHLVWELVLSNIFSLGFEICVTCTLRELEMEGSIYEALGPIETGLDDLLQENFAASDTVEVQVDEIFDVVLPTASVFVPTMVTLQPNPIVFYGDYFGDQMTFQLLWFSMPYHLHSIKIVPSSNQNSLNHGALNVLSSRSRMILLCRHHNRRKNVTAWAFSTWSGKHILVMAENQIEQNTSQTNLLVKGNDEILLNYCVEFQKEVFVSELTEGKWILA